MIICRIFILSRTASQFSYIYIYFVLRYFLVKNIARRKSLQVDVEFFISFSHHSLKKYPASRELRAHFPINSHSFQLLPWNWPFLLILQFSILSKILKVNFQTVHKPIPGSFELPYKLGPTVQPFWRLFGHHQVDKKYI